MTESQNSQKVRFRLCGPLLGRLQSRADGGGSSIGECARECGSAELQEEHRRDVGRRLSAYQEEVASLRHYLSLVLAGQARARNQRRSLRAIDQDAPFERLCEKDGAASLFRVIYQHESGERDALSELADGNVGGALAQYVRAGRVHIRADHTAARDALLDAWHVGSTQDLSKTVVLTATNADREVLNKRMQNFRVQDGELHPHDYGEQGGRRFFNGDRVLFKRTDRVAGFSNDDLGTIEAMKYRVLGSPEVAVRLDRQRNSRPVRVVLKVDDSLELGYALTAHKDQGGIVERAFVLGGSALQSLELAYRQLARASERTDLFVSETEAGEDPVEFSRSMERPLHRPTIVASAQYTGARGKAFRTADDARRFPSTFACV